MKEIIHNASTGEIVEREFTAEEEVEFNKKMVDRAWTNLRAERDSRLTACDWTVLSDTPTSTAAWKTYRQQLRDLPANTTDPFNPIWPTPPA